MELPQIGRQCEALSCKQLDFLPYTCKCKKIFCGEHYKPHINSCPEVKIVQEVTLKKIDGVYKCSNLDCKETSIIPLLCEKCNQHFCIVHRHVTECFKEDPQIKAEKIEKLNIPIKKFNEAKAVVDKQVDSNISNAKKKNKNLEMANKLQLMRIKNKATGLKTIPSMDRVYFNVRQPKSLGEKTLALFISKMWTVGRAIDAIAEECKVKNNNNKIDSLKLQLFKLETGEVISPSVSDVINNLLRDKILIDGENLILEYCNDKCVKISF